MATAKKTTTAKKPTSKQSTASKKVAVKKQTTKEVVVPKMRSFRVSANNPGFRTFKITRQTVYWVTILSFIIFMQLWILSLQMETSNYIEEQNAAAQEDL
jgi:hypothetical protein